MKCMQTCIKCSSMLTKFNFEIFHGTANLCTSRYMQLEESLDIHFYEIETDYNEFISR